MRRTPFVLTALLIAATFLSGCNDSQVAQSGTSVAPEKTVAHLNVPSGTSVDVTLATALTSETAGVGDAWHGSIQNAVTVDGKNIIPAGSAVVGTVASVKPAHKGDRAMLELGLTSITVDGHDYRVQGTMEPVIAGSTRARNLGAIGAATAAGALVGNAVSGSTKGTVIGAVVGGGAATGVVSQTKGWQVVLKDGTPLTFTTHESVAVRL